LQDVQAFDDVDRELALRRLGATPIGRGWILVAELEPEGEVTFLRGNAVHEPALVDRQPGWRRTVEQAVLVRQGPAAAARSGEAPRRIRLARLSDRRVEAVVREPEC